MKSMTTLWGVLLAMGAAAVLAAESGGPNDAQIAAIGYQWWVNPDGCYRAIGIFGQMVFLDARADVVIVTNSAWPEADWDPGLELVDAFNRAVVSALRPDDSRARGFG